MAKANEYRERRTRRTRRALRKRAHGRPRLSVFRANKHIYAQVIDDGRGVTLAAASTLDKSLRGGIEGGGADAEAATRVGRMVSERALAAGVKQVVFDRGSYRYHGRVKAL